MNNREEFLKNIARTYTRQYGNELLQEMRSLDQGAAYPTENLERRVRSKTGRKRKRGIYAVTVACIALALLMPQFFRAVITSVPPGGAGEYAVESAEAHAVIPLSFSVPAGFEQTAFEQDNEKSIYYFQDDYNDDVVVTLEHSTQLPDTRGLVPLRLGETSVYAVSGGGYSLMTFVQNDVLYLLTCRHDVNTLLRFSETIL